MSKEKQIEEMAKLACTVFDGNCHDCSFDFYPPCPPKASAERLYNAGYRKQSEPFPQAHENGGEWIVTDADSGSFGEYEPFIEFKCLKCESVYGIESGQYGWEYGEPIPWVACPLCGAKMKGGEENEKK